MLKGEDSENVLSLCTIIDEFNKGSLGEVEQLYIPPLRLESTTTKLNSFNKFKKTWGQLGSGWIL